MTPRTLEERLNLFDTHVAPYLPFDARSFLLDRGFFTAPASTKYHGSYEGGLFDHSFNVMNYLVNLTRNEGLNWERDSSPYIIGFFHDLCKIDCYKKVVDSDNYHYEYDNKTTFKGHGIKSVLLMSELTRLTEEEVACIVYHMGAFTEKEEWNDYTGAIHKYENVLWTHTADMLASHVMEVK